MNLLKRSVGWASWLIVAVWLYGFIWSEVDDALSFALPAGFYLWLDDLIGPTSEEGFEDLFMWSTSALAVVALHAITFMACAYRKGTAKPPGAQWIALWRKASSAAGWICWLLVATSALITCVEAIYRARNGTFPNYAGQELTLLLVSLIAVGSLHLTVVKVSRRRPS